MIELCSFTVPGRAIPALRMTQGTKYSRQAKRYFRYKNQIGWGAKSVYKGKPTDESVGVELDIYLNKGNQGDIDNYFKSVTDSLNKIVYTDDKQVKEMNARKIECSAKEDERVEVTIYKLKENE